MAIQIIHKHSSVITDGKPKLPTSSQIEYGELAVNYAKDNETISLKNNENEIVEFKSTKYLESIIKENEEITAASLTDLDERVSAVDEKIDENNEAISASLNDLNERITILGADLGNYVTSDDLDNYATSDDLSDYTTYNDFTGHTNDNSIHLTIGTGATNAAAGNHKHISEDITDSISLSVQILPNTTELVQGKAVLELVNTKISASTNQLQGQIDTITEDYAKKNRYTYKRNNRELGICKKI